jgi:cytoskeletal protein RodZ
LFEIGTSLREARTRQGLDFPELEQATKIRVKYLKALEDEQFEQLPSQTYIKGFLHAYADHLGLDGQVYVDEYNTRYVTGRDDDSAGGIRPRHSEVRPRQHRQQRRIERNVVVIALLGIAIVTALVFAAWKFGGGAKQVTGATPGGKKGTTTKKHTVSPARLARSVKAAKGDSTLQVRVGSASGRQFWNGTLLKGRTLKLPRAQLWISLASPENVVFRLRGQSVPIGARRPCVVVITRAGRIAPAVGNSC